RADSYWRPTRRPGPGGPGPIGGAAGPESADQMPMDRRPGTAPDQRPGPSAEEERGGTRSENSTPATVLLLAAWIGLAAGFVDLGLFLFRKRLIERDAVRLDEGFPWIIPAGGAVLV